jgi:hypothetical protein
MRGIIFRHKLAALPVFGGVKPVSTAIFISAVIFSFKYCPTILQTFASEIILVGQNCPI